MNDPHEFPATQSQDEQEAKTNFFLKTDGPSPGAFAPDIPDHLLAGKTESEQWLYKTLSTNGRQNEWLIQQTAGLKGAHRLIHTRLEEGEKRFANIETILAEFTTLRKQYLAKELEKKDSRKKIIAGALALLILPFLSIFGNELVKHLLHWP